MNKNLLNLRKILLLAIGIALPVLANAQSAYWQQSLSYNIDVKLNDKEKTLDGFLKLNYRNNSPDTLRYIWFHLWPNAFRNDRTAFSEQLLENGRTDFYFSDPESRGYINRLDFRTGNQSLKTEEDLTHIDLIKVYLAEALLPGASTQINTPFHVKLPYNFSRGGYNNGSSFQITQWYPSPAVYDAQGWHPMPYLDQGEFYSDFGKFKVQITVPANYVVAATGQLQNPEELEWLKKRSQFKMPPVPNIKPAPGKKTVRQDPIPSSSSFKTLVFEQDSVHDFAWFADKAFVVESDTIQLSNGSLVNAFSYYHPESKSVWKNSLQMIRDAVQFRSTVVGTYPYQTISVVEASMGFSGGMEYPTITSIAPMSNPTELESVIEHEIGHNWFQGILASNERDHPWLDEGFNTYYDLRYNASKSLGSPLPGFLQKIIPGSPERFLANLYGAQHKDQPITTSSVDFTPANYNMVAYYKTAYWMQTLETALGKPRFDSLMKSYYETWKFRHPQPSDFIALASKTAGSNWPLLLEKLQSSGPIDPLSKQQSSKPSLFVHLSDHNQPSRYSLLPLVGYNSYDKLLPGVLLHNYNLPPTHFRYAIGALYGLGSGLPNFLGRTQYTQWNKGLIQRTDYSLSFFQYSTQSGIDSTGKNIFRRVWRLTPVIKFSFKKSSPRSTIDRYLEFKSFLTGEQGFKYKFIKKDSAYHPYADKEEFSYINQLSFVTKNSRTLYPYDFELKLQQGNHFYRASATANYFYNYAKFGGASIRLFTAKFGYLGTIDATQKFATYRYQPKLTANRGDEDYTYSNYFTGRTEQNGLASQQILNRDGNLHLRTDLFQGLQGRSDDWVAAINLSTTIPQSLIPDFLPLKLFLDLGTHADAWKKGYNQSRFFYVGGLQLSLLRKLVNIYIPLVYSSEFADQLKTVPEENKLMRKISFSIDIQSLSFQSLFRNNILP